jgi:hypothetical protein
VGGPAWPFQSHSQSVRLNHLRNALLYGSVNDLKGILLGTFVVAMCNVPSPATTIVLVRTPEHIVVAADSLWLRSTDWHHYFRHTACKIGRVADIYFVVSTVDADAMQVQALARRSIRESASVFESARNFSLMVDEIAKRSADHEVQSNIEMCRRKICTEVAFFGIERGVPVIASLKLEQIGGTRESLKLLPHKYLCPGNCDRRRKSVWIVGRSKHIIHELQTHPRFVRWYYDLDAARALVKLEAAANPDYVGGPIDVLTLNSSGAHWASVEGGTCSAGEITPPQGNR